MSKTPRTDAQLKLEAFFDGIGIVETVEVEFAQQLETQLAEARAEIERLKGVVISQITPEPVVLSSYSTSTEPAKDERKDKLIEQMREALEKISECRRRACYQNQFLHDEVNILAQAALAAERGE